ncbi:MULTISPECIES: hypothetical protein [unclassified Cobetia]|nr:MULTISPECIES: hypothetical protein [unclassified Cobetia]MDH2446693.1 hypothetical protein [Cobetia sp. 2AS]
MPYVSIHPHCPHEHCLHEHALIASLSESQIISSTSDTRHV